MTFETFIANNPAPFHIYTDGSCLGNPGDGGYGIYIHTDDKKTFEQSGAEADTTNNRMEMMAAIKALELFVPVFNTNMSLIIYTDSQYLKNGITTWIKSWKRKNWKTADNKPVKNQDLWERLDALNAKLSPRWEWVQGHNNHFGNERADALARNAVIAFRMSR